MLITVEHNSFETDNKLIRHFNSRKRHLEQTNEIQAGYKAIRDFPVILFSQARACGGTVVPSSLPIGVHFACVCSQTHQQ